MDIEIGRTDEFTEWLRRLKDRTALAKILTRIDRLAEGNPGQCRSLGGGVTEMKIDFGPRYRVYFTKRGKQLILLLCGGDKNAQDGDICRAKQLASNIGDCQNEY